MLITEIFKKLSIDFKSRMNRARDMGFDTSTIYYHGTMTFLQTKKQSGEIIAFDPKIINKTLGGFKNGIWLTTNSSEAEEFTDNTYGPGGSDFGTGKGDAIIYPLLVNTSNILDARKRKGQREIFKIRKQMKRKPDKGLPSYNDTKLIQFVSSNTKFDGLIVAEEDSMPFSKKLDRYIDHDEGIPLNLIKKTPSLVMFDPTKIRSVHATFDTRKRKSADLLS